MFAFWTYFISTVGLHFPFSEMVGGGETWDQCLRGAGPPHDCRLCFLGFEDHTGQGGSILGKWSGKCQYLKVSPRGGGDGCVCVYLIGRAPKHLLWTRHLCEPDLEPAQSPFPAKILSSLLNINNN